MQSYDEIVNSGTDWLGYIPAQWSIRRGKFLYQNKKVVNKGMAETQRLALTLRGVIERKDGDNLGLNPESLESYQIFEKNDLVFKLIDLENKQTSRVGLTPKRGIMSPAYIRLTPKLALSPGYFFYYYYSLYLTYVFNNIAGEGVRANLSAKELLELPAPAPSLQTQQKIADYLDTETAQIDNLIAKQERLLELLEEKRRATITHAVTRGLNPSVELKETNIPWLAQIPAGWKLGKVYQYCKTGSGTTPNASLGNWYTDKEIDSLPWITTGELRENTIKDSKVRVTNEAIEKHSALKIYSPGTLLIAMYGATIGRLATLGIEATTNQACCALMPTNALSTRYLYYYLFGLRDQLIFLSSGGGQPNISKEKIDNFPLLIPNISDQELIATMLDKHEEKTALLKQKIQTQIKLLKERRTSLISHAVTGKIKI